jgi:hypothetical protein
MSETMPQAPRHLLAVTGARGEAPEKCKCSAVALFYALDILPVLVSIGALARVRVDTAAGVAVQAAPDPCVVEAAADMYTIFIF